MNNVTCTADLFDVLQRFDIPVVRFGDRPSPREIHEIISDMFRIWNRVRFDAERSRPIADALDYLANNGVKFDAQERLVLNTILDVERDRVLEAPELRDEELVDFLNSFRTNGR